ncbi:MAG TPA: hypothetical protein VG937_12750 [Polyangiaceae bacterium]|nr:hypothetical protein [Polyangiaceae bacterium]
MVLGLGANVTRVDTPEELAPALDRALERDAWDVVGGGRAVARAGA